MARGGGRAVLLAAVAAAAAGILVPGGAASSMGSHATSDSKTTTRVTVTETDFKVTLSRHSAPWGTVIFSVTNKGKIAHVFKIAGKKTPLLSPGHSATLRVLFSGTDQYPYLCTGSGQARHSMKGVFTVVAPPPPTTTTTPYSPPTGTVGTANTTVTVNMFDDPRPLFVLSQKTIPSGMVTFVINNKCLGQCSFDLQGVYAGRVLGPAGVAGAPESDTWTVALAPGVYRYHCDILPLGMKGTFTVTP